jgi:hypothetical protein
VLNGQPLRTWAAKYVDPGSRMAEILFGLIMTLTFTLGAGMMIEQEGRAGAWRMLIATVSCNVAWGVIDGVFYVLGQLFERSRLRHVWLKVTKSTSDGDARSLVANELDELLVWVTEEGQRQRLYDSIVQRMRSTPLPAGRLHKEDLLGGLASGVLVFTCSFPAVLPFVFMDDPGTALRVSNALLLLLLFLVGYRSARETMARPWLVGLVFLLVGVALVAGTIALGG